jgi:hypothetical protein
VPSADPCERSDATFCHAEKTVNDGERKGNATRFVTLRWFHRIHGVSIMAKESRASSEDIERVPREFEDAGLTT